MAGIRALAAAGERLGRYALIGEPTAFKPVYMHKGVMLASIRLRGRSGHAQQPEARDKQRDRWHAPGPGRPDGMARRAAGGPCES